MRKGRYKSLDFGICGTQGRRAMIMMVEEREKVRRGRPPGGGEGRGVPVRVPAEIAEQARVVGQLEGKTMGEVLVAFAAEALEAAYHAAMAARERYAARTVGRRPEARGAAPEPRRGAAKVSAPAAHTAAPEPGTKTERILDVWREHPDWTQQAIAAEAGCTPSQVSKTLAKARAAASRAGANEAGD